MDLLSPQVPVREVTVMKGAQLGFTECGINMILYCIDRAPAPMLYVMKTVENVKRFSKQRLDKSIRLMPEVFAKVGEVKSRDSNNTIQMKTFPGGILILGGANSSASLRSMPIQNLILDEEDSYELDIGEEGSPSELAIARTRNFPRRKIFRLSTPTIKEISVIEPNFESGSRERFHVPCPHCGVKQVLYWTNFRWDNDDPHTIRYICIACHKPVYENHKTFMLENGEWIAENPEAAHKSFHISGLYSPLGFFSWVDAAAIFIKAVRTFDKALLKVFVNTVLAETWTEEGRSIEAGYLERRREPYASAVPDGVWLLTAGVDVQEDRIEVEVVGHGLNNETWSVDYVTLMGDTETSFVWDQLADYLHRTWRDARGNNIPIACTAVDSGHRAAVVYRFCAKMEIMRVFAVKGSDGFGRGYISRPKRRNDHKVWLFTVYVDEVKSKIYSQLQVDTPGPGYAHFPARAAYDTRYFQGLTSERLVTSRKGGRTTLKWELPKGKRNEPLDCRCYAMAALYILNPNIQAIAERGIPLIPSSRHVVRRRRTARVVSNGVRA